MIKGKDCEFNGMRSYLYRKRKDCKWQCLSFQGTQIHWNFLNNLIYHDFLNQSRSWEIVIQSLQHKFKFPLLAHLSLAFRSNNLQSTFSQITPRFPWEMFNKVGLGSHIKSNVRGMWITKKNSSYVCDKFCGAGKPAQYNFPGAFGRSFGCSALLPLINMYR